MFPLNRRRLETQKESFACARSQYYFKPFTDVFLLLKWARMKLISLSLFFFFLDIPLQRNLGQNSCSVVIFFGKENVRVLQGSSILSRYEVSALCPVTIALFKS